MSEVKARLLGSWLCHKDSTDHRITAKCLHLHSVIGSVMLNLCHKDFFGIRECSNVSECIGHSSVAILCLCV